MKVVGVARPRRWRVPAVAVVAAIVASVVRSLVLASPAVADTAPGRGCTRLRSKSTAGQNCAARHAEDGQGGAADPVNTATGNFHESFDDVAVAGRGPGLGMGHSYNSLNAATDGPLGYGWSYPYG